MRRLRSQVSAATSAPAALLPYWEQNMNEEQLAVIRHEAGPLACFAGAGSGKTRALVHRVARLVEHVGTPGERVFCVTFSQAGAREMNERLRKLGVASVNVQTWHAFCLRVLKEEQTREAAWTVDDKDRAKLHVKTAMGYKHENWVGGDLTKVRRFIGICKANLWAAEDPETLELARKTFGVNGSRAVRVYSISQNLIEEQGLLTFDDMLVFVARYFRDDEGMRSRWAARFDHVLQDEAQDANRVQVILARALAQDSRNYMIVGDPGQAIFGFRGSSPEYLAGFPSDWEGSKVVTMARNYRSGAAIVSVANDIIREGAHHLPEDMSAAREDLEGEVRVVSCETLEDEGRDLVDFVKAQIASGRKASDICILYRLNAQSRAPEEGLLKAQIPYVIVGGTNFYERKEVKDLLAYVRLAAGRDSDGDALKRCINAPFRFLGAKFVERVAGERERDPSAGWAQWVERAANGERIQARQRSSAFEWVYLVQSVAEMIERGIDRDGSGKLEVCTANEALSHVVTKTRYIEWLEKEEGEESIESSHGANVRELLRVATAFRTVAEFLDFVEKQIREAAKNKRRAGGDAVTMMTIHRSKGLEWPLVWIVGCNESVLPHIKGDDEEERRLMYVAVTRARDLLVASHVQEMATRSGVKTVDRSRYLGVFPLSSEDTAPESTPAMAEEPQAAFDFEAPAADESGEVPAASHYVERNPGFAPSNLAWLGEATCVRCEHAVADCVCH